MALRVRKHAEATSEALRMWAQSAQLPRSGGPAQSGISFSAASCCSEPPGPWFRSSTLSRNFVDKSHLVFERARLQSRRQCASKSGGFSRRENDVGSRLLSQNYGTAHQHGLHKSFSNQANPLMGLTPTCRESLTVSTPSCSRRRTGSNPPPDSAWRSWRLRCGGIYIPG